MRCRRSVTDHLLTQITGLDNVFVMLKGNQQVVLLLAGFAAGFCAVYIFVLSI